MFYQSLIFICVLTLTSQIPVAMRASRPFAVLFLLWAFLWLVILALWHIVISHPPAVFTSYLFLFIAISLARIVKLRSRWFSLWSVGCVVLAYAISFLSFIPVYEEHQRILAKYAPVDLKVRLAYERSSQSGDEHQELTNVNDETLPVAVAATSVEAPQFDSKILDEQSREFNGPVGYYGEKRLQTFEALNQIHTGFVADFIEQPALGVGRLPAIRPLRELDIENAEGIDGRRSEDLVRQPEIPETEIETPSNSAANHEAGGDVPAAAGAVPEPVTVPAPSRETLQDYHLESVLDFAPRVSLGVMSEGLKVSGFQSHAMLRLPGAYHHNPTGAVWKTTRIELVSLLKHRPPAVYVSEHLPAMNELREAPTRPTTPFERDAISKLRQGEELVVQTTGQTARMVGSIRAIDECRKCHQVPLGGLLGAFSYRLNLANPRKPEPPKPIKGQARFNDKPTAPVAYLGIP